MISQRNSDIHIFLGLFLSYLEEINIHYNFSLFYSNKIQVDDVLKKIQQ